MAVKSRLARAANAQALRERLALAENPPPLETLDLYTARRLVTVRSQITAVDRHIEKELNKPAPDPKWLREFAGIANLLVDLERKLAGWPPSRGSGSLGRPQSPPLAAGMEDSSDETGPRG